MILNAVIGSIKVIQNVYKATLAPIAEYGLNLTHPMNELNILVTFSKSIMQNKTIIPNIVIHIT